MDDPYDLVLGMFALAIAAVMLVAGELYLVAARPTANVHAAALGRNVIHQRVPCAKLGKFGYATPAISTVE